MVSTGKRRIVADDTVCRDYTTTFPVGFSHYRRARLDLMAQFTGCYDNIELISADKLTSHKTDGRAYHGHLAIIKSMGRHRVARRA